MGQKNCSKGCKLEVSPKNSQKSTVEELEKGPRSCNKRFVRESGSRRLQGANVLCQVIHSAEARWDKPINNGPVQTEQKYIDKKVQIPVNKIFEDNNPSRSLVDKNRLGGCILAYPSTSNVSPISGLPLERSFLPVPSSPIRFIRSSNYILCSDALPNENVGGERSKGSQLFGRYSSMGQV